MIHFMLYPFVCLLFGENDSQIFFVRAYFFSCWEGEQGSADTLGGHVLWFTERGKVCRAATEVSCIWNSFGDNHEVSNQMIRKYIVSVSQSLGDAAIDVVLGFRQ